MNTTSILAIASIAAFLALSGGAQAYAVGDGGDGAGIIPNCTFDYGIPSLHVKCWRENTSRPILEINTSELGGNAE